MTAIPGLIIAVDGYSSTGKSTFAKNLGRKLGLLYLDSGAMYRAVTLAAQEAGIIDAEDNIDREALAAMLRTLDVHFEHSDAGSRTFIGARDVESEIRSMGVSSQVSPISAVDFVREWVDARLHEAGRKGGIIMDGRDIGATVFPEAQIKIFITASDEVRAQRRYNELRAKGREVTMEEVAANLKERDYIDSHREVSPLRKAEDAYELDNSDMTPEEDLAWAMGLVRGIYHIL